MRQMTSAAIVLGMLLAAASPGAQRPSQRRTDGAYQSEGRR